MSSSGFYADVILPLAIPGRFTYAIPSALKDTLSIGQRAVVQFGKNKVYSAIVVRIHAEAPPSYKPKEITYLLDENAIVNAKQLSLWEWISEYYMANPGDVMNAALPSIFKLQTETKVRINLAFDKNKEIMDMEEQMVLDALETRPILSLEDIMEISGRKQVYTLVKQMIEKNALSISEEFQDHYKPLVKKYIRLSTRFENEEDRKSVV